MTPTEAVEAYRKAALEARESMIELVHAHRSGGQGLIALADKRYRARASARDAALADVRVSLDPMRAPA